MCTYVALSYQRRWCDLDNLDTTNANENKKYTWKQIMGLLSKPCNYFRRHAQHASIVSSLSSLMKMKPIPHLPESIPTEHGEWQFVVNRIVTESSHVFQSRISIESNESYVRIYSSVKYHHEWAERRLVFYSNRILYDNIAMQASSLVDLTL